MRPARALFHPLWLAGLALYALNDHVLKGSTLLPQAVIGKLSDVGVLLVTPAVLATLTRVRTRRGWLLAHVAMGVLFTLLELSPTFTSWWSSAIGLLGFRWITWGDWTDLLTLPTLALSFFALGPCVARPGPAPTGQRRVGETALVACASYLCIATSDIDCPPAEEIDPDEDQDHAPWSIDCDDNDPTRNPYLEEIPGDGIDQDCDGSDQLPQIDTNCPDVVTVQGERTTTIDTSTGANQDGPSCAPTDGTAVRLEIVFPDGGLSGSFAWLTVEIESDVPHVLAVDQLCPGRGAELACVEAPARGVSVPVFAYQPSYVTLRPVGVGGEVRVTTHYEYQVCGDGVRTAPEACDDGNFVGGDGCDPVCRREGTDT